MARPGITYAEVAEAATQLVGQNKNPTIEQIRLLLGSGSSTTIANHLRQWKESQTGTNLIAARENIPNELIAIVKGLWERVLDQSEEKVTTIAANYEKSLGELQQELLKYKNNNQRWQHLFNQWTKEKEQLTGDKIGCEQALETLQKSHDTLIAKQQATDQQLQEKHQRIEELHRLHTQTQANLEHYRETTREQRLIEQQQFEQQKQSLQMELKNTKDALVITQEKSFQLQQQQQLLQQSYATLEKNYAEMKSQYEIQQTQLIEIEKLKNEHNQASQRWENQYIESQKILETQRMQLINSQVEVKTISQQLASTQFTLNETLDLNKSLGHEKWILAQEKAHLEGQLKQMQAMIPSVKRG